MSHHDEEMSDAELSARMAALKEMVEDDRARALNAQRDLLDAVGARLFHHYPKGIESLDPAVSKVRGLLYAAKARDRDDRRNDDPAAVLVECFAALMRPRGELVSHVLRWLGAEPVAASSADSANLAATAEEGAE